MIEGNEREKKNEYRFADTLVSLSLVLLVIMTLCRSLSMAADERTRWRRRNPSCLSKTAWIIRFSSDIFHTPWQTLPLGEDSPAGSASGVKILDGCRVQVRKTGTFNNVMLFI
jgi:hypothetical protein